MRKNIIKIKAIAFIQPLANINQMNKLIGLICVTMILSCSNVIDNKEVQEIEETEEIRSMNDTGIPIYILRDSVEAHGSVYAFDKLDIESLDFRAGEFLSTFMIMADKYNNDRACMKVYDEIVYMYEIPLIDDSENGIHILDSLNLDARKMAIRYLEKADSLGNKEAKEYLLEYKKVGIIK